LANAAAKGITVLAASGDQGSSGNQAPGPISVCYPASSPNVVAVGGTILNYNTSTYARFLETASVSSGGGISTVFPVPTWQTGLQANLYFTSNGYSQVSTITGRGVPDISAPYQTYVMYYNNNIVGTGGTSASCPIMAGMLARFMSLNGGRRPIPGAIHKILY
jgi:kumamolisin